MRILSAFSRFTFGISLDQLRSEYIAAKTAQGLRPASLSSIRSTLDLFIRAHPCQRAKAVTAGMIAAYINKPQWAQKTRLGHLVNLSAFFQFAVRRGHIKVNPCTAVDKPIVEFLTPEILTPAETAALLNACERHDPELIGHAALCAFGGLRPMSEVARMTLGAILLDRGVIQPSTMNKTRRRRLVTVQPNLKAWLERWLPHGWRFQPPNFWARWRSVRAIAGITHWPADVLRHSFVSYHLALLDNDALTAKEAGHSQSELHESYKALVTKPEAEAYFAIMPDQQWDYAAAAAARELRAAKHRSHPIWNYRRKTRNT